jgi:type IV secretion system protein VirD4
MSIARLLARSVVISALFLVLGYPAVYTATHGLNPRAWPNLPNSPATWVDLWHGVFNAPLSTAVTTVTTYLHMFAGTSPALASNGRAGVFALFAATITAFVVLSGKKAYVPARHYSRRYGDARFASQADMARMRTGLELGLNPETNQAVRVQVQGNLLTIAPPRSGKTSGAILPNLLFPDVCAWAGPVVVIDPKGDVVRAVRRRREYIGQTVRVIDPLDLAGGGDRWDPLANLNPDHVLELQGAARALLPDVDTTTEAGSYFRDRAVVIVATALQIAVQNQGTIIDAAELIRDGGKLLAALEGRSDQLAQDARNILTMAEKTRGEILSTAAQAVAWLLDPRMQASVVNPTISLDDLCSGTTDLYVVIPADKRKHEIAPYVRWLLDDMFETVRRLRVDERIVVIIDEAAVLGKFSSILQGSGELPGYGVSLWTFWQSEHQITEVFGSAGKDIMIGTAEVLMLFNLSMAQGEERQRWSDTLGTFTGVHETLSTDPITGKETKSTTAGPEALVPSSELARMTHEYTLVFLNSGAYTTDPLKLRKTLAHDDQRFRGLASYISPVGPTTI